MSNAHSNNNPNRALGNRCLSLGQQNLCAICSKLHYLAALPQAITEAPLAAGRDVAGLQLALGVGAAIYFLRENKKAGFGARLACQACSLTGAKL